jgi:hypothetical protein
VDSVILAIKERKKHTATQLLPTSGIVAMMLTIETGPAEKRLVKEGV